MALTRGWGFPSAPTFFGPNDSWRESFLEESFLLQYHLKMSYSDIRSLPVPYRRWFIERIAKEFRDQNEAQKKAIENSGGRSRTVTKEVPMGEVMNQLNKSREKKF